MQTNLYILANSPGEMSGWVAPVVAQARRIMPQLHITVALIPDWFTSGREQDFGEQLPVDRVVGVFPLIRELWRQRRQVWQQKNLVLFLGGDALYAKGLSRLLRCSAMAYMPRVYHPQDFVRIFVPTQVEKERAVRKGACAELIVVVPTLALDSVTASGTAEQIKHRLGLSPDVQPVFTLMAGSRPSYVAMSLDFMLDVADLLLGEYAELTVLLPISPFIDREMVLAVLEKRQLLPPSATRDHERLRIGPAGRIVVVFSHSHDAIAAADLAIVLPGTNNLQCAALGTPFIMLMPLNSIESIPFEGLLGLLYPRFFPFNHIKKWIIAWMSPRVPYMSMVNRMAGRMLAPEMRGVLSQAEVAAAASELWQDGDRRAQLRSELIELTRERGAARIIAEAVREHFVSDQRLR
jgi:lipid-A-disaccharide synthase